ncbi:MAG: ATP-binding protein [Candidatus Micrarchaeia archaeon]
MIWQRVLGRDIGVRAFFSQADQPSAARLMSRPSESIYIGRTDTFDVPFFWDFKPIANPHIVVVGMSGSGKSYLVKTIVTRASLAWDANCVILDWTGEYAPWVKANSGTVVSLGSGDSINILEFSGMKTSMKIGEVMESLSVLTDIDSSPMQKLVTRQAIESAYKSCGLSPDSTPGKDSRFPTLSGALLEIEKQAKSSDAQERREAKLAYARLLDICSASFDSYGTKTSFSMSGLGSMGLVCIDLHALPTDQIKSMAGLAILQSLRQKMRSVEFSEKPGLALLIVVDEAWKIAQDDKSDLVTIIREGRKYSFGVIVASQSALDISKSILINAGTSFVFRAINSDERDYIQGAFNFPPLISNRIASLPVGSCAVHLSFSGRAGRDSGSFIVKHVEGEEKEGIITIGCGGMEFDFDSGVLSKRLIESGLTQNQSESIVREAEASPGSQVSIVHILALMEKWGYGRQSMLALLRNLGLGEENIATSMIALDKMHHAASNTTASVLKPKGGKHASKKG